MIDPRDIAACVLAAITNSKHQLKAYDLTGPEALSLAQAAETARWMIGRAITQRHCAERRHRIRGNENADALTPKSAI